ncbi:MAG: radical SAM protein [Myxococcota bacterium]
MSLDIFEKEKIATEKRYWLRTTRRCNNHCIFCHDSEIQNGEIISTKDLKAEIDKARNDGYTRLILSGGEPTIHPEIIQLIRYAKSIGFEWIQIISNGRMFAYPSFTSDAARAGLNEVTVSFHSHIQEVADRLTDIKGSYKQTILGIQNLKKYNLVISIDIVLNRLNINKLTETIEFFYKNFGIAEFDLLHLTPFGRALENYERLIVPFEEEYEALKKAIHFAQKNNIVLWTNRVPPEVLEGNESFIQDPHKILDEINGRREIFEGYLRDGVMVCRKRERCGHCFVRDFCEFLIEIRSTFYKNRIERLEINNNLNSELLSLIFDHLTYNATILIRHNLIESISDELIGSSKRVIIKTDTTNNLKELIFRYNLLAIMTENFELTKFKGTKVILILNRKNFQRLASQKNLTLLFPNTESIRDEFENLPQIEDVMKVIDRCNLRVANLPKCISKSHYKENPYFFKAEFITESGFDLFEIARDFILKRNYHRSLRCKDCIHYSQCPGMHINHIRRFGFGIMKPVKL